MTANGSIISEQTDRQTDTTWYKEYQQVQF